MTAIQIKKDYLKEVEGFVENICDQYRLSDNYFGNILISLLELMDCLKQEGNENLEIHLSRKEMLCIEITRSDEVELAFDFSGEATNQNKSLFMIRTLTDKLEFSEDQKNILLYYDISHILEKKAEEREEILKTYLSPKEAYQKNNH